MVAIIAQQHRTALGSGYPQEIDAGSLFKDVCGAYLNTVTTPEQLRLVVDTCRSRRHAYPLGKPLRGDTGRETVPVRRTPVLATGGSARRSGGAEAEGDVVGLDQREIDRASLLPYVGDPCDCVVTVR